MQTQMLGTPSTGEVTATAKDTLETVVGRIKDNKLLIGGIVAGCGAAAIFLLATDSGKQLRHRIRIGAEDLYDLVSEQVEDRLDQLHGVVRNMRSERDQQFSRNLRRVA
jgi:gas vesicle protein